MAKEKSFVDSNSENFYAERSGSRVWPTEFVVRTFLARYPKLAFIQPKAGSRVLDVAFGDGRNTVFLCDQGCSVSGIEVTDGIVRQTEERLRKLGYSADLRVGRNSRIPFGAGHFDYLVGVCQNQE